jgi:hypothetical protein
MFMHEYAKVLNLHTTVSLVMPFHFYSLDVEVYLHDKLQFSVALVTGDEKLDESLGPTKASLVRRCSLGGCLFC